MTAPRPIEWYDHALASVTGPDPNVEFLHIEAVVRKEWTGPFLRRQHIEFVALEWTLFHGDGSFPNAGTIRSDDVEEINELECDSLKWLGDTYKLEWLVGDAKACCQRRLGV